jgi:hypothetical protein
MRPVPGRQLHHQRAHRAGAAEVLEQPCHGHGAEQSNGIEREHHQTLQAEAGQLALRHEGGDQQRVDRQARRAGHQRRQRHGHPAVARVGDGARGQDAGNRAGVARQQRDEAAPRQAQTAHQAVQQVGRARQVAAVLQHQDEGEQDQDLRQEDQHAADAGHHAVDQQAAQPALAGLFAELRAEPLTHPGRAGLDPAHRRLGPGEDGLEDQEQQRREQQQVRSPGAAPNGPGASSPAVDLGAPRMSSMPTARPATHARAARRRPGRSPAGNDR